MKKTLNNIVSLVLSSLFFLVISSNIIYAKSKDAPKVSADGAVIMNANTGEILYEKNMNQKYPPASTTKIMTALLTLEKCNLEEEVTVSKKCEEEDGSKIYIFDGEKIKVKDLLYSLLMASANDSALALAEHVGGDLKNFSNMMNERAKELGCNNTNFVNPNGLYDDKHRTSAHDLALIMKELIKHEEYIKISKTSEYNIPPTNKSKEPRHLWNGNRMIHRGNQYFYEFCEAAKTGYTVQSLHSYVVSAKKGEERYIVALIHDPNKQFYKDSVALFNYAFNNFETKKLISKGDNLYTYNFNKNEKLSIISDRDISSTIEKGTKYEDFTLPSINLEELKLNEKDIKKGDFILGLNIKFNTKEYPLKLISGNDHTSPKTLLLQNQNKNSGAKPYIKFGIILVVVISVVIISVILLSINKWKKTKKI
ncbi:D-alanyl-D-alanine carboxypeptidase family protein [Hathewaya massiliensis]|uniref:D-alanyl-D-alanine carboxypeptidase family protein n=1 Tax=Hathewaya massiliensis TaxID=1964382 RepID=UPI0011586FDE|nr:D-alanyl-D-alanine carboxypeptidase family protein [Hathewaya massiliensis]